jgi:hypothetical protein
MKQDIRDLFKEDNTMKVLPENHREEFLSKLQSQAKRKSPVFFWMGVAAVAILVIVLGFNLNNKTVPTESTSPVLAQIEAVEAKYLKDIEKEWQSFVALANDERLVERFKVRLDELDKDYQEISSEFTQNSNNIAVIEALVENLQTRLRLLKDIQEHIKILNQNNEQNEKSI